MRLDAESSEGKSSFKNLGECYFHLVRSLQRRQLRFRTFPKLHGLDATAANRRMQADATPAVDVHPYFSLLKSVRLSSLPGEMP